MFADLLRDLEPWPGLHARTLAVLSSLPAEVQQDAQVRAAYLGTDEPATA